MASTRLEFDFVAFRMKDSSFTVKASLAIKVVGVGLVLVIGEVVTSPLDFSPEMLGTVECYYCAYLYKTKNLNKLFQKSLNLIIYV